ncbi:hypothetical protein MCAP1_003011 [Malassezia caprae]|uniref:Uncharacterized protein n=1 Tax=Malassezia caprae TaxID=1381934 RepID=A0AAF0E7X9_9BASI|nr:hypothetical protein MCAP1_003011 [Malassezia caprae]
MSGELPATTEFVGTSSSDPALASSDQVAIPLSDSTTDTYRLPSGSLYTQTEEQEQETRSVEEYLRRLSEKEKRQRRKRADHAPLQPAGGTSLARKFSASLARVPSLRARHTPRASPHAGSYEMTQSNYTRDTALPTSQYRPVSDESEESQFMSGPPSADPRQDLQDMAPLQPVAYIRSADLSSTSLDDLSMFSDARKPDDTPVESPTSPLGSGSFPESTASPAMARLRSRDFPSVTVGRASSLQRRQQSARAPPTSLPRHGNTIEAIPESESADVALAAVPDDAQAPALQPVKQGSTTELPELSTGYPRLPPMSCSERRDEPSVDADRWYWSDLLLTCGLCLSTNDDEEQAARTNPME